VSKRTLPAYLKVATFGEAGEQIGRALTFAVVAESNNRPVPEKLRKAMRRMARALEELAGAARDACAEIDKSEN
jgi:hypothetical protein